MAEYSKTVKGSFFSTGSRQVINLPFAPDTISMWNYTAYSAPAQHGIPSAYWDSSMGQGTAEVKIFNATPVLTTGVVTTQGFSTFTAGRLLMFGPQQQVIGATAASPIVFNVSNHGYVVGDTVQFEGLYQTSSTGMPQICGMAFTILTVVDANHFQIYWDGTGSNYTALSGSPAGAYVRKILYPFLYEPGVCTISAIGLNTPGETFIQTTQNHNFSVGQIIGFRIPRPWGTVQLNSLPNNITPGMPVYYYVTSVTGFTDFTCSADTTYATPFNVNIPVAAVNGLTFAQVYAVGDVNTGGIPYGTGTIINNGPLYPSPMFPTYPPSVPTINGPAIVGSFVNCTSSGFVIGSGSAVSDASSHLVGASTNQIFWEATYHDYSAP